MNVEDKQYLFDNLFRHIEKNVDLDSCFDDPQRGFQAYIEFMTEVFGDTYYGNKKILGTYAEKENRK